MYRRSQCPCSCPEQPAPSLPRWMVSSFPGQEDTRPCLMPRSCRGHRDVSETHSPCHTCRGLSPCGQWSFLWLHSHLLSHLSAGGCLSCPQPDLCVKACGCTMEVSGWVVQSADTACLTSQETAPLFPKAAGHSALRQVCARSSCPLMTPCFCVCSVV